MRLFRFDDVDFGGELGDPEVEGGTGSVFLVPDGDYTGQDFTEFDTRGVIFPGTGRITVDVRMNGNEFQSVGLGRGSLGIEIVVIVGHGAAIGLGELQVDEFFNMKLADTNSNQSAFHVLALVFVVTQQSAAYKAAPVFVSNEDI
jgi:hypothetical protein